jgi:hypothetical protein
MHCTASAYDHAPFAATDLGWSELGFGVRIRTLDAPLGAKKSGPVGPPSVARRVVVGYCSSGMLSTLAMSRRALRQFRRSDGPSEAMDVSITLRREVLA